MQNINLGFNPYLCLLSDFPIHRASDIFSQMPLIFFPTFPPGPVPFLHVPGLLLQP